MTTLQTETTLWRALDNWLCRTNQARRASLLQSAFRRVPWAELHGAGGPIYPISLPHMISGAKFEEAQRDVEMLVDLLIRLERAARQDRDSELWQRLYRAAWPESQSFLDLPWYESEGSVLRRYRRADAAFNAKGVLQFMEKNMVGPQGMNHFDIATAFAANVAEVIGLQVKRSSTACASLLDWLVLEYQERYQTANVPPCIAVPVEPWWPSITASIPPSVMRMQSYADRRYNGAVKLVVCHDGNLWIEQGQLYVMDEAGSKLPCSMIWRNGGPINIYPEPFRTPSEVWRTILCHPEEFLVLNNPTGPRLTRNKDTLAILGNRHFQDLLGLTEFERNWIQLHIPRTYHLQEDLAQDSDALRDVLRCWQDVVFKPSDGGLGGGVKFGSNFGSQGAVQAFMRSPEARGYVVQWRIDSTPLTLPHLSADGRVWELNVDADFCPMVIGGKVGWPLCRGKILSGLPEWNIALTGPNSTHNLSSRGNSALVPILVT